MLQSFKNHRDLQLLFCPFLYPALFQQLKFWISKYENFKYNFGIANDYECKSHQLQDFRTHWDLQLLFWLFLDSNLLKAFKIWILKYKNFKYNFGIVNDFKWKGHHQQSCITHRGLQLLFWSFLYQTLFEQFEF